MRRLIIMVFGLFAFVAAGATAGGPPVVNTTDHVINQPFTDPGGIDCATGNASDIVGVVSGVVHTLVLANGSVYLSGNFHGAATNDDLPTDGVPEATTTFVSHFGDIFFASGKEIHTFGLHGEGTATATGEGFRFDAVLHIVLDTDGTPKVIKVRIVCR
jgi:hypothetical protein